MEKKHQHLKHSNINIVISALLLLLLACSYNNSPGNLMNKETLNVLKKNPVLNYLFTFFIIYFVIDFTYQDKKHPFFEVGISLIILVFYCIYVKVHYSIQITLLLMLVIIFFLNDNINYSLQKKNNKLVNIYTFVKNILITLFIFILLLGYIFKLKFV